MKVSPVRLLWVKVTGGVIAFYATVINRCRVTGAEHIPRRDGVLFLANHISGFDTVFLPAVILRSRPWTMVWAPAKEELFANRFLGAVFRSWGAFPVKRGRDVRAGKELGRLMHDDAVMLFPEGTRHKDGHLGTGNRGVGKLIYNHRPVVIPVSLSGINRWKVFGMRQKGEMRFGAPLDYRELLELPDEKSTHILLVERVMAAIAEGLTSERRAE